MRLGPARALDQALTQRIDREKIRAHAFEHDLAVDVDHVPVTNAVLVHDRGHLDARSEFAALRLRAKNTDLRSRQIFENDFRHPGERAGSVFLEHEDGVLRADLLHFQLQRGGDFPRLVVRDNRDPLFRPNAQADTHGISGAG